MKKVVCEMCGSTNILKQDGVWICKDCGCQYSTDEVKKMIIEGAVDVTGSEVKIDTKENEKNYLINARNALNMEDWEDVNKYYGLIKNNNPDDIEAIFFSEYGNARLSFNNPDFCVKENAYNQLIKALVFVVKKCNDINKEYELFEKIRKSISENYYYVYHMYEKQKTEKLFSYMHKEIINKYATLLIDKIKKYKFDEEEKYNKIIEIIVKTGIGLSKNYVKWLCFPEEVIDKCKTMITNKEYEKLNELLSVGVEIKKSLFYQCYCKNDYSKYIDEIDDMYEKNKYFCAKYMDEKMAIQVYESLGNYLDSKKLLLEVKYKYGKKLLDSKDGRDKKKAIRIFENMGEYLDSKEILLKIKQEYEDIDKVKKNKKAQQQGAGGCYIATAVYGSYDCPKVWVLRRFRDYELSVTLFGRIFIKLYYSISPTIIYLFGKTKIFNIFWRKVLDDFVEKLKSKGYKDTKYYD